MTKFKKSFLYVILFGLVVIILLRLLEVIPTNSIGLLIFIFFDIASTIGFATFYILKQMHDKKEATYKKYVERKK